MPPAILALFAFVLLQLVVGCLAARSIRTADDYLLAGRNLGPTLAAGSIFATWFGSESCVGAAGTAYEEGVGWSSTEPFAYGLCLVLLGLLFAARLWRLRITTLADFFAQRFGTSTERLAAVLLLPSSILWAAAQVRAFGHVVASNSSGAIEPDTAILIAAVVAVVYTAAGGLLADVYTDLVQAVVLVAGLAVLAVAVWSHTPADQAAAVPTVPLPHTAAPASFWQVVETWAVPICGSLVAQEAISRSLAARSAATARNAALLGGGLYLAIGTIPLLMGLAAVRIVPGIEDPEAVLPNLSRTLLPGWLNLVFAGALLAAILSTVDSCLLVASSVMTRNLVPRRWRDRDSLLLARAATLASGGAAYVLARTDLNVHELVEEASGFASAGVCVLAFVGCFGRMGRSLAANLALVGGALPWLAGRHLLGDALAYPYLASLAGAVVGFVAGAVCERGRGGLPGPASD